LKSEAFGVRGIYERDEETFLLPVTFFKTTNLTLILEIFKHFNWNIATYHIGFYTQQTIQH
jgi:hypothetical protein